MGFRAAVAMPGHFGVELDPRQLNAADRAELAGWIAFHKDWRNLLHQGQVWLGEGSDGLVWQAQGTADEFLLFAIRTIPAQDRRPQPLRLPFLCVRGQVATHRRRRRRPRGAPAAAMGRWRAHFYR
jgi:alpha-galactosidase